MSECVKTLFICVDVSVGQFCRVGWDDGMHIKHLPSSTSSLSFSIFVFGAQLSLHCPVLLPFRAWLRRSFHQIQRCGTWQIELSTLWKLMFHPSAVGWDGTHHRQGEVAQFDQFCAHGHCAGSKWLGHSTLVVSGPCFFFLRLRWKRLGDSIYCVVWEMLESTWLSYFCHGRGTNLQMQRVSPNTLDSDGGSMFGL